MITQAHETFKEKGYIC